MAKGYGAWFPPEREPRVAVRAVHRGPLRLRAPVLVQLPEAPGAVRDLAAPPDVLAVPRRGPRGWTPSVRTQSLPAAKAYFDAIAANHCRWHSKSPQPFLRSRAWERANV